MTDFSVSPSQLDGDASAIDEVALVVDQVAADLASVDPGNPELPFSSAIGSLHTKWDGDLRALHGEIADVASKLHGTAEAYRGVEAANEQVGRLLGAAVARQEPGS